MAKKSEGYRFIQKDPAMDLIRTIMHDSGWSIHRIAKESGVAQSTLHNWDTGITKRPQNLSITMVMAGLGYSQVWRNASGQELYVPSLPKEPAKIIPMPAKQIKHYRAKRQRRAGP